MLARTAVQLPLRVWPTRCCASGGALREIDIPGPVRAQLNAQKQHLCSEADTQQRMPTFELVAEQPAYQRYLSVFDRKVRVVCDTTGQAQDVDYDVVGHPRCNFCSVTVLPFHPAADGTEPQFTLIREYCQGPNAVCYNVPSGGFDPKKHASLAECAQAELSEEALLQGGQLVQLTAPGHPGFYEVKWCLNRFTPFLVIDPEVDPSPGDRDAEEHIQVVRVGVRQLEQLAADGELMLPSMMTVKLALEYLRHHQLLPPTSTPPAGVAPHHR